MTDMGFPIIEYEAGKSHDEWGLAHGESMRTGIRELVEIRRGLMQEKNRGLTKPLIEALASEQWSRCEQYDQRLTDELSGIATGAGITRSDVIVLNNYTDFRDIVVPDQGCSVVYARQNGRRVAGQTWDMHGSAKNYVCVLKIPEDDSLNGKLAFSVVGCLGMMGFARQGVMVGVNNINTNGARAGIAWPLLIRRLLDCRTAQQLELELTTAPVTSGHGYLAVSPEKAQFWEVMPDLAELIEEMSAHDEGAMFHTNHCLGPQARQREVIASLSSTTNKRFELLAKKVASVCGVASLFDLLNDHENYPMSICSHYQTSSIDPSFTCGGAAGDLDSGQLFFWRGDALFDDNFRIHRFDHFFRQ